MKALTLTTPPIPVLALLAFGLGLTAPALAADKATIQRGALLVGVGGCMDCHTPFKMGAKGPEKDRARGLSGHPAALRLGTPPKLDDEEYPAHPACDFFRHGRRTRQQAER